MRCSKTRKLRLRPLSRSLFCFPFSLAGDFGFLLFPTPLLHWLSILFQHHVRKWYFWVWFCFLAFSTNGNLHRLQPNRTLALCGFHILNDWRCRRSEFHSDAISEFHKTCAHEQRGHWQRQAQLRGRQYVHTTHELLYVFRRHVLVSCAVQDTNEKHG